MKPCEKILLDIVGRALFGARAELPADTDLQAVYEEACHQAVPILVFSALTPDERARMPAEIALQWRNRVLAQSATGVQLLYEQQAVLSLMKENGIPCAVLKGSSVACHYPEPVHRVMGDIDILVPPDRSEEAVRLLQAEGYGEILEAEHHCHYTVSKGRIMVEVHREPNGIHIATDPQISQKLRAYFADAPAEASMIGDIPVLSVSHQAVVLLLHKLEHFLSGGLGLRQLCDWACFVHAHLTPDAFERLRPTLTELGLMEFAGIITRAACDWLALPADSAPWCMAYDRELAAEVMEEILASGNFGCKDSMYGQRFFVDFESSGRVSSFFKTMGVACRHHWKPCEKHKILMPIAPAVVGFKYLRMRIRGERPDIHLIKLFHKAGPKQRLYKSLKPFQGD